MAPGYSEQTADNNHDTWGRWNALATSGSTITSGSDDTWSGWNSSGSTTYTTYTTDTVWADWNDDCTSTPSHSHVGVDLGRTASSQVWYYWNTETGEVIPHSHVPDNVVSLSVPKENHKERMKLRRKSKRRIAIGNRRREKARRKKFVAEWKTNHKARQLLEDVIGKEQMIPFDKTGRILVKGQKFDWLIEKTGMVKRIEKGKLQSLCVHLDNHSAYPKLDSVVGFCLMAKHAEDYLDEKANKMGAQNLPDDLDQCAQM